MPPPLTGLSLSKKPTNPLSAKRKAVFDSDSDDERSGATENVTEISTIGGVDDTPGTTKKPGIGEDKEEQEEERPAKRKVLALGQGAKPKIKPLSKNSIFADEDDNDNNSAGKEDGTEKLQGKADTKYGLNNPNPTTATNNRDFVNLSAMHSSKKHAAQAEELDPSIYSYDAVYESLHAKPAKKNEDPEEAGVPRYMTSLLRSAEIRKRDQLRARDKLLAKEREAEGEEFADKEKFVTAAYKAQQEELRRVEEEEKAREAEEEERRRKNGGSGMVGFYRDLLAREEEQHEAVMKAADEAAKKVQETGGPEVSTTAGEGGKTEAQLAAELNSRGAHIAVNDDGQVVDKRQLLSAGLNVAPKPKQAAPVARTAPGAAATPRVESRQAGGRAGQRARQTEMIAAQLEEQERQRQEAEAARLKEIAERSRSQKTSSDVASARERYLARKREREAAKGS
ncbi:coiled-coil domain-containing protein 55-domain containing protein [Aspergillus egyptiacus]|nr:coiled-coil domain-containing protein 55-domain containing protein [Aspergillus egyptiacus]